MRLLFILAIEGEDYLQSLKKDINSKDFKNYYLFYGEEEYLKKYYEQEMKNNVVENMPLMNIDIYEGKEVSLDEIESSINTLPFMSDYKLVILKKTELFNTNKKYEQEKMTKLLENMSDRTVLVFIEKEVDKRGKLFKNINKLGSSIEFKTPTENELLKWLYSLFKINKKSISTKNSLLLLRSLSYDMNLIKNEVAKLCSFVQGEDITEDDIKTICTKSLEAKIFDMIDAITNKDTNKALDIFNNLLILKESPLMVISMIARQFRLILLCKSLSEKSLELAEIAELAGVKTFVVRECLKQSKNYTEKRLIEGLKDCLKSDVDIKSGLIDAKLYVEMLIIKYSM